MFDVMSFLSKLARRLIPHRPRRAMSITCSAFMARRPFFPCGADHGDVVVDSTFLKPKALRKLKPRRIGGRDGNGKGKGKGKGGDAVDGDEACVWRRAILLGRRCQPLEFAGAIHYDCEGQRLWQPRTPPRTPIMMSPVRSSELGRGYMDRA